MGKGSKKSGKAPKAEKKASMNDLGKKPKVGGGSSSSAASVRKERGARRLEVLARQGGSKANMKPDIFNINY